MKTSFACSPPARLRGLLGRSDFDGALMIAPCAGIHTYGMRFAIDVAFAAQDGTVLKACRSVPPGMRVSCPGAAFAVERRVAPGPWMAEGSKLDLCVTMGM